MLLKTISCFWRGGGNCCLLLCYDYSDKVACWFLCEYLSLNAQHNHRAVVFSAWLWLMMWDGLQWHSGALWSTVVLHDVEWG